MAFIELSGVSFSWPRGKRVLDSVDLRLEEADTFALFGANGSGKTTLSKLMLGLLATTGGSVLLQGRPLATYSLGAVGRRVGYVRQDPEKMFFASTVAEEIGFPLRYRGFSPKVVKERVAEMLALFELEAYRETFPLNLSRGEKQRLALAAVIAGEPGFLVLDEPFSGLDRRWRLKVRAILARMRDKGVGFLLISHDRDLSLSVCQRTLTLVGGRFL